MGQGTEERVKTLLQRYEKVGIDTTPFIYHFEANPSYIPFTKPLFRSIEGGHPSAVTSVISLMEILVKPKREGNLDAVEEYKFVFSAFPNLQLRSVDEVVAEKAAELRAKYMLRPPDAIQVAATIVENAQAFITNDERMKQVQEIEILIMKEVLRIQ